MKRDPRVAFFDVTLTDAIESPPWGTEHTYDPGVRPWTSTPGYWEPVLSPHLSKAQAVQLIERVCHQFKGPAYYFLVLFDEPPRTAQVQGLSGTTCDREIHLVSNVVQLAFLKTESGADDLLQFSNCRPPMWWSHPKPPPPPPKPNAWNRLMGPDLI
jgi:hypothetical protein